MASDRSGRRGRSQGIFQRPVKPAVLLGLGILAGGVATPALAAPAADDSYETLINTPLTGVNVTDNDNAAGDLCGNAFTVIISGPDPAHGTASLTRSGELTFTPAAGFTGTASLDYQLIDSCSIDFPNTVATVTIAVSAPSPPPVTAVPTLETAAIGGLSALVAALGVAHRRRRKKED